MYIIDRELMKTLAALEDIRDMFSPVGLPRFIREDNYAGRWDSEAWLEKNGKLRALVGSYLEVYGIFEEKDDNTKYQVRRLRLETSPFTNKFDLLADPCNGVYDELGSYLTSLKDSGIIQREIQSDWFEEAFIRYNETHIFKVVAAKIIGRLDRMVVFSEGFEQPTIVDTCTLGLAEKYEATKKVNSNMRKELARLQNAVIQKDRIIKRIAATCADNVPTKTTEAVLPQIPVVKENPDTETKAGKESKKCVSQAEMMAKFFSALSNEELKKKFTSFITSMVNDVNDIIGGISE